MDAGNEHAPAVEVGAVSLAPEVDARIRKVPRAGEGHG